MTWTLDEFIDLLEQDPERRILFVEGNRDISFWRVIVPTLERGNTEIYPISEVEIEKVEGGARGRLVHLANLMKDGIYSGRILFFADADYDRVLTRDIPENVILTDGKDLESYSLHGSCLNKFILQSLAKTEDLCKVAGGVLRSVCRPLAALRVTSERKGLKLPFQKTIGADGLSRYISGRSPHGKIEMDDLIRTLIQRAGISLKQKESICKLIDEEIEALKDVPDDQIIHGKDMTHLFSWMFGIDRDAVEFILFACIDFDAVRKMTNISRTEYWIRHQEGILAI